MKELNVIHNKNIKNIFLDIFDTIVFRSVQPEYVKKTWCNHIIKTFNMDVSIIELYKLRNRLETQLGEKAANSGFDWEFKYIDLLKELYSRLNLNISEEKFIKTATELEINIESAVQYPDSNLISEIKKAKKEGKKIYCISDMYLSKKMVEKIFTNIEIIDLFDDIFISCEYLINKKSGKIYEHVLKTLNCNPNECIMIGDNFNSDYENPKKLGLNAIHLDRTEVYKKYELFLSNNNEIELQNKFNSLVNNDTDNFENSIFSLYLFIERLYFNLIRDNYDEVIFLSREGEYLKRLFDKFVEKINNKKIKSHYLLVSRKSTYLPSLKELKNEDFSSLLMQYSYISIVEFLKSLNLEKKDIEIILKSYQNDCKKIIETAKLNKNEKKEMKEIIAGNYDNKIIYLYESKLLKYLKKNTDFERIYEKNRKEQSTLFKEYITSITKSKEICLVDIGWNGSIQDNIQRILGDSYKIKGYFYGLVSRNPEKCVNKKGLIFSNAPTVTRNFELYAENRTIFEILLGASHGSANKYVKNDNNKVEVLLFKKQEEEEIYKNVVSVIQNKMFTTFEQLIEILPNGFYDNKKIEKQINKVHYKMVFKPTKNQLTFFNRIYHYENFGVFEFTDFKLHKKITPYYYIKENAKYILKNRTFFYDAFWPTQKLYLEKLYIPLLLYRGKKYLHLKRKRVI